MEPNLGDALLRREERIHTIQMRLRVIQAGPLRSLINAIIADLESELGRIEVSKVDHPAFWTVGKLDDLTEVVGPDESSSVRMGKMVREKGGRRNGVESQKTETRGKVLNHNTVSMELSPSDPEQHDSMYDLHPRPETIEYSTQLVDEWFAKHGEVFLSEGLLHLATEHTGI
ncbi:hypothetical protein EYC84_006181 [Monilinia fructicola]|uniref:Uncharacterized protein n=1 Tax=Monilinia fructicola TaxID=38448 RepID=A0A5M9K2J4_MONFR|nr:hypothetical protein EYC84_006181 [Monilinia fructicola]